MTERGIIMRDWEVRAIREGRKTQTRRVIKPQPRVVHAIHSDASIETNRIFRKGDQRIHCPYGKPGDRLWVRETWDFQALMDGVFDVQDFIRYGGNVVYKADGGNAVDKWIPSIHMPRRASRLTLEIVSVRVERLNDISNEDCWNEGMCDATNPELKANRKWFSELWESINGPGSWDLNPWVWVIEHKEVTP